MSVRVAELERVRRELCEAPVFGRSDRILRAAGELGATLLVGVLQALRLPAVAVGPGVGLDPGVRVATRLAYRSLDTPDREVLRAVLGVHDAIASARPAGLAACVETWRYGEPDGVGVTVVMDFRPANGVGTIFEGRLRDELLDGLPPLDFSVPDARQAQAVEGGMALLARELADVGRSSLDHVAYAFLMVPRDPADEGSIFASLSANYLPGVIFLSPFALRSPLIAAEFILHEATHCKLYNLYLTRSILRDGYTPEGSPQVVPPWRPTTGPDSDPWGMDRTLAAAHVYLHLAVLYARLAESGHRDAVSGLDVAARGRSCWDRGDWLARAVDGRGRGELGADGVHLIDWLTELFARLGPSM